MPIDVFRQEMLAQFLDDVSGVFHGIDKCIHGEFEEYNPAHRFVVGWDVAKFQDYSVACVLNCDTGHVCRFERRNRYDFAIQVQWVADIAREYHANVLMDATGGGEAVREQLAATGVPVEGFVFTNNTKREVIHGLIIAIEQQAISFPHIPVLLAELQSFEYKLSEKTRAVQYEAPAGQHDDCVTALALAQYARGHHPPLSIDKLRDIKKHVELKNARDARPVQGDVTCRPELV